MTEHLIKVGKSGNEATDSARIEGAIDAIHSLTGATTADGSDDWATMWVADEDGHPADDTSYRIELEEEIES